MVDATPAAATKWMPWVGFVMSGLVVLFMLMDATMKLLQLPIVLQTTEQIGWPTTSVVPLGILLLLCTALYVLPRTSVLGGPADGLSGRRRRHSCTHRQSHLQPHAVRRLSRRLALGWHLSARSEASRAHARARERVIGRLMRNDCLTTAWRAIAARLGAWLLPPRSP